MAWDDEGRRGARKSEEQVDAERRIEEMDKLGIDIQLVSPTDVFYQYDKDPIGTATVPLSATTSS